MSLVQTTVSGFVEYHKIDLAYFAGLLDGEGCVRIDKPIPPELLQDRERLALLSAEANRKGRAA